MKNNRSKDKFTLAFMTDLFTQIKRYNRRLAANEWRVPKEAVRITGIYITVPKKIELHHVHFTGGSRGVAKQRDELMRSVCAYIAFEL
mgnify:CR=1 FL=1